MKDKFIDTISESIGSATGISEEDIIANSQEMSVFHKEITDTLRTKQYNEDYDYVRDNLRTTIEQGMGMINCIISLAKDSENARSYEVAGTLLKVISEINKDLLAVSKSVVPVKAPTTDLIGINNSTTTNNTTVFVGTAEDVFARIFQKGNTEKVIEQDAQ